MPINLQDLTGNGTVHETNDAGDIVGRPRLPAPIGDSVYATATGQGVLNTPFVQYAAKPNVVTPSGGMALLRPLGPSGDADRSLIHYVPIAGAVELAWHRQTDANLLAAGLTPIHRIIVESTAALDAPITLAGSASDRKRMVWAEGVTPPLLAGYGRTLMLEAVEFAHVVKVRSLGDLGPRYPMPTARINERHGAASQTNAHAFAVEPVDMMLAMLWGRNMTPAMPNGFTPFPEGSGIDAFGGFSIPGDVTGRILGGTRPILAANAAQTFGGATSTRGSLLQLRVRSGVVVAAAATGGETALVNYPVFGNLPDGARVYMMGARYSANTVNGFTLDTYRAANRSALDISNNTGTNGISSCFVEWTGMGEGAEWAPPNFTLPAAQRWGVMAVAVVGQ
jgi:hypothetical protein